MLRPRLFYRTGRKEGRDRAAPCVPVKENLTANVREVGFYFLSELKKAAQALRAGRQGDL